MKKTLLLLFMLCASSLLAQQRQVKVRLFSSQLPSSIKIIPQREAAIDGVPMKAPANVAVGSNRVLNHRGQREP